MRIALVLKPMSDQNLTIARQIGVSEIVGRFPGESFEEVAALRDRVAQFDLKLSVIEGYLPMQGIVLGRTNREEELQRMFTLIRSMGKADVRVLCYNFMSTLDMTRTKYGVPDRGGALVNRFDADELDDQPTTDDPPLEAEQLWDNLRWFLERAVPVAEEAGVKLAMHPDDPPGMPRLHGQPRIMGSLASYVRLVELVPSANSGVCFCQGCFSEMGEDVTAAIRRLGPNIHYVHFRDVVGCTPNFRETFHDCGQTDMAAAMRAYREIGFDGPMRPDHVPMMAGENDNADGYSIMGRLFAVGYMRGLMHATESVSAV